MPLVLVLVVVLGTEKEPECNTNWTTRSSKFFDDARGSGTECAACLDALVAKRACEAPRVEQGKALQVRLVSMLSRLVDRFSPPAQVREASSP
jgi:hypothetical protein